jgi:hypothetical protein
MRTRRFCVSSVLQLDPAVRCTTAQAPLDSLGRGAAEHQLVGLRQVWEFKRIAIQSSSTGRRLTGWNWIEHLSQRAAWGGPGRRLTLV